jgi:hypothetical protein
MTFNKLLNTNKNTLQYLNATGIVLVIIGSVGHFFDLSVFKYLFGLGALLVVVFNLFRIFKEANTDFRQKRLFRINIMMSLLLILATYSMFDGTTLWMAIILIYALVVLMMTFRT